MVISPDNRLAALEDWSAQETSDLWILDLSTGVRTRFTFVNSSEEEPLWSPDGSTIYYSSNERGVFDIYRKSVDGSEEAEPVLTSDRPKVPLAISPDGTHLLYRDSRQVWIMPLDDPDATTPLLDREDVAYPEASFSPDGRWISYTSTESGQAEVYVMPYPGPGRRYQVSRSGGFGGTWRSDGREILIGSGGAGYAVPVELRGGTIAFDAPRKLFDFHFETGTPQWDFTRFLVGEAEEVAKVASLVVVTDWTTDLER
jgi:Tol biopolymer transport system component